MLVYVRSYKPTRSSVAGATRTFHTPGTQVLACAAAYTGSVHSCDGYPRCRTRAQNRYISDEKEWEELMGECMDKRVGVRNERRSFRRGPTSK